MNEKRAFTLIAAGGFVYIVAAVVGLRALGVSDEASMLAGFLAVLVLPVLASVVSLHYSPERNKRRRD